MREPIYFFCIIYVIPFIPSFILFLVIPISSLNSRDWIWTFQGLTIINSPIGIDLGNQLGSLVLIDSLIQNCPTGIRTGYKPDSKLSSNSVLLDNVKVCNDNNIKCFVIHFTRVEEIISYLYKILLFLFCL
jgi:hypothetical protein